MGPSCRLACIALLASCVALLACKEDEKPAVSGETGQPSSSGGGAGGGGGKGDGGSSGNLDSGSDGSTAACNVLANDANVVDQNRIVGEPPAGTGGQIADGTYELTAADLYVGAGGTPGLSGVTYKGVLSLSNGKLERVTEIIASQTSTPVETRNRGDVVAQTGNASFTVTQSCPGNVQDLYSYSVLNNTFTIVSQITKESLTYTLR